ncbi:MAG: fructokinase [Halieaceae bacterium MED-G27]|nr:fructokinase [Halieaceae bacterium]OUT66228.1 MAG: hypothetical protein CBB81_04240 [Cellvibrionales bacterium TMED21]PDH38313.1 MAG: fructokinase [Halieaceae bacterium MED-G27]|tara:strand:+ start:550 stop:1482 length:933 start_codon:yes stop_codon:yes gene_type:complete
MNESAKPVIAAIEAGGTKVQVAVGSDWAPSAYRTIHTTNDPIETMAQALAAIDECSAGKAIDGIGIASFGPIEVNPHSDHYGVIGVTPKTGWQGFDYRNFLGSRLEAPVAIDTDVNAAALAEYHLGNHSTEGGLAYATIGTGIGVGIVSEGSVQNGSRHPEIGHIPLRRHPNDRAFTSVCPFHPDCAEGFASGPAVIARWGRSLSDSLDSSAHRSEVLDVMGDYLGQIAMSIVLHHQPSTIVLGGGVMESAELLTVTRKALKRQLGGYFPELDNGTAIEQLLAPPTLAPVSGTAGAFLLGLQAATNGKIS